MTRSSRPTRAIDDLATSQTRQAHRAARAHRSDSLETVHELEAALGAPGPGRPEEWLEEVRQRLMAFAQNLQSEQQAVCGPDGLLGRIRTEEPRLYAATDRVQQQYTDIVEQAHQTCQSLEQEESASVDVPAWRERLAALLAQYRRLRAAEADLAFEAYSTDLGAGD